MTYIPPSAPSIPVSIGVAKGDLVSFSAASTPARLVVDSSGTQKALTSPGDGEVSTWSTGLVSKVTATGLVTVGSGSNGVITGAAYLAVGTAAVAASGTIRLPVEAKIKWLDSAAADIDAIGVDATDNTYLNAKAGKVINLNVNGALAFKIAASSATVYGDFAAGTADALDLQNFRYCVFSRSSTMFGAAVVAAKPATSASSRTTQFAIVLQDILTILANYGMLTNNTVA